MASRLERWSIFLGRCDGDRPFAERCDTDVFWTNVTIATGAIIWTYPSLTMLFKVMAFHEIWLAFMNFQGIFIVMVGFDVFKEFSCLIMVFHLFKFTIVIAAIFMLNHQDRCFCEV